MKILYVITKANWGGAQRYVFDLATAAHERGHEVVVVYGAPGLLSQRLAQAHVRCIEIPTLGRDVALGADRAAFFSLRREFAREKPDVVHLNSSKAGAMGALAARLCGVKRVIFTAHGWAFNEDRPLWQKIPIALLHWLTVALCHRTIAVSRAVARDARRMPFVSDKITVIHNGAASPEFLPRNAAREALLPGERRDLWLGTIGELHPVKRTRDLIEAFSALAPEFPDAILAVMGEGQERERLEALIREKSLQQRVFLLGHVADAPRYLQAFDLFALPSRSEGLAYALIEAGLAGLPVVATRTGGIPEIIEGGVTGLLVPREDPAALAQALRTLLTDPRLRERLGANLSKKIAGEFSLERMVERTLSLYQS